jgi:hypothetical protein
MPCAGGRAEQMNLPAGKYQCISKGGLSGVLSVFRKGECRKKTAAGFGFGLQTKI